MSYKDMNTLEYWEKLNKIMDSLGRTGGFCECVLCDRCKEKFKVECIHNIHTYNFEKAVELVYNYKFDILDKEEKEYLSAVIKPFRDRVDFIKKGKFGYEGEEEYVEICLNQVINKIYLPDFEKDTMYKGMELGKEYTLEDLGL